MCGRYTLSTPGDELASVFDLSEGVELEARFNIAPTQQAPIVRLSDGQRWLELCRWGLVPYWADDPSIGTRMINARSETAHQKPAYREAFQRKRCLVPADGFYEWKKVGRHKQPYYFSLSAGEPFAFAGLWDRWRGEEETVTSFSILTAPANQVVADVHDRMPVILPPQAWSTWLAVEAGDDDLGEMLRPLPDDALEVRAVSTFVNSPANDSSRCVEAIELGADPEAPQQALF